jgi:hypothetical protein
VPQPRTFEVQLAIEKLKSHKSLGIDQIPKEMTKAGGRTIPYKIHILIIATWNKKELPEWKELFIVPVYKKGDKPYCSNYRGISLLSTMHKILSHIPLSRLIPHAEEITGNHKRGF